MSEYQANHYLARNAEDQRIAQALRALRARPESVEARIARLNDKKPGFWARIVSFFN